MLIVRTHFEHHGYNYLVFGLTLFQVYDFSQLLAVDSKKLQNGF